MSNKLLFISGFVKNFRSIGADGLSIDFLNSSDTVITSEDNGAGKSTMTIHGLFYNLFDKPYGDGDNKSALINSNTRKDCVTDYEYSIAGRAIRVVRGMKPTRFEIYEKVDGEWSEIDADAAKKDQQAVLEGMLGFSASVFYNAIALGVDRFKPFINMKVADRRPFVETVLGLEVISEMADVTKKRITVNKAALSEADYELSKLSVQLEGKEELLGAKKIQLGHRVAEFNSMDADVSDNLVAVDNKLKMIGDKMADIASNKNQAEVDRDKIRDDLEAAFDTKTDELKSVLDAASKEEEAKADELKAEVNSDIDSRIADTRAESQQIIDDAEKKGQDGIEEAQTTNASEITVVESTVKRYQDHLSEQRSLQTKLEDGLSIIRERLTKSTSNKSKVESKRNEVQVRVDKFMSLGECPSCHQDVPDEHKNAITEENRANVEKLGGMLVEIEATIDGINEDLELQQEQITAARMSAETIQADIDKCTDELSALRTEQTEAVGEAKTLARVLLSEANRTVDDLVGVITRERDDRIADIETRFSTMMACHREEYMNDLLKLSEDKPKVLESKLELPNSVIAKITEQVNKLSAMSEGLEGEQRSYRRQEETVNQLRIKVEELTLDVGGADQDVTELQASIDEKQTTFDALDNESKLLAAMSMMLKDNGIKAAIVEKYIPFINTRVNDYLDSMGQYYNLEMDTSFNVTMNAPNRRGQTVYSLSNGQKARINLAFLLAWRDVADMRSSVSTNLVILDETLENISESGVREAIDLVKAATKDKNLFVITQRSAEFAEHFRSQIHYKLVDEETVQV